MKTLVHLSDLHFGRIDSVVVEALPPLLASVAPDLTAISGDFTQRATRSQFTAARAFLDRLHMPKLLVPGNHDVPLWNAAARFFAPHKRYQAYISHELEPEYVDEEIIVLGINTARSFAWGEGRINARQIDRIVQRLSATPSSLLRVLVTHHPFDLPPGVSERRLLGRARMAMAKLATVNADLFLSGHLHVSHASQSAERYRIEGHSALIVQAGTVSMRGRGEQPSFNVLRVQRRDIELSRRVWDPATATFVTTSTERYRHTESGWIPQNGADT